VIVVHLRQHVDCVRIEREIWVVHYPKSVKLMTKRTLAKYELRRIGAVKAIHTICSTNTVLEGDGAAPRHFGFSDVVSTTRYFKRHYLLSFVLKVVRIRFGSRMEETSDLDRLLSDVFQITDNVLSLPAHAVSLWLIN
jgi:hypothetical protein